MAPSLPDFIHGLPKCELHVHLEGCLTPDLAKTLAVRNSIPLPDSISKSSTAEGYAFHDLTTFLQVYYPAMTVLQTEQDFHDLAWAYLTKAASQNVRHVELFFDPQAHTTRGVPFTTVLNGYHNAILQAKPTLNISAGLIMCILRDHTTDSAMSTLSSALQPTNATRIIGLGLDSDERDNPPLKFHSVFARARTEGQPYNWKLTMHCDIDQANTQTHIRQALYEIGVDRLDHGTNIVDDPDAVAHVVAHGIGLTSCPISNGVVTPDFKGRELVALLRQGVKMTVNSDDPAYFRGYVEENLLLVAEKTDLTWKELVQLERNAFEIAWLDDQEREGFLRELDAFESQWLDGPADSK